MERVPVAADPRPGGGAGGAHLEPKVVYEITSRAHSPRITFLIVTNADFSELVVVASHREGREVRGRLVGWLDDRDHEALRQSLAELFGPQNPLRRGRHATTSKQVRSTEPAFSLRHAVEPLHRCLRAVRGASTGVRVSAFSVVALVPIRGPTSRSLSRLNASRVV